MGGNRENRVRSFGRTLGRQNQRMEARGHGLSGAFSGTAGPLGESGPLGGAIKALSHL